MCWSLRAGDSVTGGGATVNFHDIATISLLFPEEVRALWVVLKYGSLCVYFIMYQVDQDPNTKHTTSMSSLFLSEVLSTTKKCEKLQHGSLVV